MALTQTQNLPAPFIQALGEEYATGLAGLTKTPMPTAQYAPTVVGQDPLQTQAATLAGTGVGAYAPYLTGAQAATGFDPSGGITAAGYQAALQPFETPYQTDVLTTTIDEFNRQRDIQQQAISDAAVGVGGYGGGRHGVAEAEFMSQTARDRAAIEAQIRQQGFQQAQQAMNTAYGQQTGLAQLLPQLQKQDIGTLGQVGATQQAQSQAERDVMREANRMAAFEPYERLGFLGQGLTGLMGGYPQQYQFTSQPNPSPLASALGIGTTLGGIFGNIYGQKT
jgi:predicted RNA methylase